MAQLCKIESVVELKSSTTKTFKAFTNEAYKVPQATDLIHAVKYDGSIRTWDYTLDGKREVYKEKVEPDEANNLITLTAMGGNVLEMYDNFVTTFQFIPEKGSLKLTMNCEKLNPDTPPPTMYLNFVAKLVKDIDTNLK